MKVIIYILMLSSLISSEPEEDERTKFFPKSIETPDVVPNRKNLWVFILAGQSNMAGRGLVEPQDTIPDKRILTINSKNELVIAKEPLHFYEPKASGLDCGLSFGKTLIEHLPDSVSVLLLPAAVGGSSISQWLTNAKHRNVELLSNFAGIVQTGKKYGEFKAVLWHQGESDAHENEIPEYHGRLSRLFEKFRCLTDDVTLPIIIGELGSFSENNENWQIINEKIRSYSATDRNTKVIPTFDLKDKGDKVHFNSKGQRIMGQRFAHEYLRKFN